MRSAHKLGQRTSISWYENEQTKDPNARTIAAVPTHIVLFELP
jgi:hypothetical protein